MELRLTLSKAEHQCLLDRLAAALEEWDDWIRRPIYEAWPQAALEVWARHHAVCWLELDHLRRQQVVLRGREWEAQGTYTEQVFVEEAQARMWVGYVMDGGRVAN